MKVSFNTSVWVTPSGLAQFKADLKNPVDLGTNGSMTMFSLDMSDVGYLKVGEATVTIDVTAEQDATVAAVELLRKQQVDVLAKAQAKHTEIEQQIQSMLAICYEAGVA